MTTTPQPTPETDAESINGAHHPQFVFSDFARKLERERDEARRNAEVERLSGVAVVAMCKRQESEIDAMREAIKEAISALQTSAFVMQNIFPAPVHLGPCGLESCCDASCMEAVALAGMLERNNATIAKLQPFLP